MPFDMFGWSPATEIGFAGRPTGTYFKSIYGYDDMGNPVHSQADMNKIQQQRMGIGQPTAPQQNPNAGNDFFAALAGLMGGNMQGGPQAPMGGANPNIPQRQPFDLGKAIAAPGNQFRQVITPGGQGPYGGVSPEGQRAMFEGTGRAWGQFMQNQQGGGRPQGLGYGPTPSSPYTPPNRIMRDPMNRGVNRNPSAGRASAGRNPLNNLPNRGGSL